MNFWARLVVTAVVTLVVGAGLWVVLDAVGVAPGLAAGAAAGLTAVVVTLGAVWVSRAPPDTGLPERGTAAEAAPNRPVVPVPGGTRVVVGEIPQEPPAFQNRSELLGALTGSAGLLRNRQTEDPPHRMLGVMAAFTPHVVAKLIFGSILRQPPAAGKRVRVVFAVTGLRGVGKSQLAAACARQRLDEGWLVVAWLDASNREQLLAGYAQLAAELSLASDGLDSAEAAGRVRHWLETGGEKCLIVLDNADSADLLRPLLPVAGHAQVIVTSSRTPLAALGSPVPVEVFTEPESVAFLAERTGLSDEDGALDVARELGCLPLALAQAAAVIAGQHLSYRSYLKRLAAVTVADSLPAAEEDPYPRGTAEAITLALNAAQEAGPDDLGRHLLEVIALLSPAGASRTLLAEAVTRDASEVDPVLQHLGAWSLVTWSVDGTTVTAHRLVMRVTREQAAGHHTLAEAARRAFRSLKNLLPEEADAWRHPVLMQEFVTQVTALAGHLDTFPGLLEGQDEQDLMELIGWAGWYLGEISDISRAIPLNERLLTDYERVRGPDHPETLGAANNLAGAYRLAGRLDDAIPLLERILVVRERVLGPEHPDTLRSRNNVAFAYQSAGRLDDAIPLLERTLTDRERVLGPEHPDTLRSRNNLAFAYQSAGRLDDAIALNERTVTDRERVLGPEHPDTLRSRNNLASAYQSAGRLDDAIPLFERTLADRERVLAPDHPDTLTTRNNLASAYQSAGRLDDAIPLFERTLADCERVLGNKHPLTQTVLRNL